MIKINSLQKVFNKGKRNEVQAIKNMTLELGDTGFYVIYGKSGSGKSTLMNMIGGLDRYDSGSIEIDGNIYNHHISDSYRIDNIGYIFQNYLLDSNLNVYENVALALRTIGITDEEVIFERTMTALANVDMEKYYRRDIGTLSGGQQQRVAIARTMAKGAKVILADEPTGNLDEYNTTLVMDILKELSKNHLIILVTHEEDIVRKYADKVIEVKDGDIAREEEGNGDGHSYTDHSKIFLGDMECERKELNGISFEFYGDMTPCTIRIVSANGKFYLDTDSPKLSFVNKNSEVQLLDSTRERHIAEEKKIREVSLKALSHIEPKKSRKVFGFWETYKESLQSNFAKTSKTKSKVLNSVIVLLSLTLIVVGMFLGGCLLYRQNIGNDIPSQIVSISSETMMEENVQAFLADNRSQIKYGYKATDYSNSYSTNINTAYMTYYLTNKSFETSLDKVSVIGDSYFYDKGLLETDRFVRGGKTDDIRGIILTTEYIKCYLPEELQYTDQLLDSFINCTIQIQDQYTYGNIAINIYVEGIVEEDQPYVYVDPLVMYNIGKLQNSVEDVHEVLYAEQYVQDPEDEVVYCISNSGDIDCIDDNETPDDLTDDVYKVETDEKDEYNNKIYKELPVKYIDNTFGVNDRNSLILMSANTIKKYHKLDDRIGGCVLYVEDVDNFTNGLMSAYDDAQILTKDSLIRDIVEVNNKSLYIILAIILAVFGILMVLLGLLMYSTFSSHIKEVGIYRAIGVSPKSIVFKSFVESAGGVITLLMLVFLIASIPIFAFAGMLASTGILYMPWWLYLTIAAMTLLGMCVVSLIPVLTVVGKMPNEILTKLDI